MTGLQGDYNMSDIPYPDTPQPDIPVPPEPEIPTSVPDVDPDPNDSPDLPPEPTEPPGDDFPEMGSEAVSLPALASGGVSCNVSANFRGMQYPF